MTGSRADLRVGVAGLGFGAAVHAPVFQSIPGVEIVAIAGSSKDRASTVADRLGIRDACQGIDELLDRPLDAVSLALPPKENEAAVARALARNLPVLCEKPLASTGDRALELARRARGRTATINYQFTEIPAFGALRSMVAEGRLGALRFAHVIWSVESYAHREGLWSWKTDADRCGGVTTLLGSHIFHIAEWLFGPVVTVCAHASNERARSCAPRGGRPADDTIQLSMRFAGGMMLGASLCNSTAGNRIHRWEVAGERASAVIENSSADYIDGFGLTIHVENARPTVEIAPDFGGEADGRVASFRSLATRFVAAVRTAAPCQPDFAVGARVQIVIDAVREAALTGRSVAIHAGPAAADAAHVADDAGGRASDFGVLGTPR